MDQNFLELLELTNQIIILRGGKGSGNWGHAGRKGKRGGSGRGGGLSAIGATREHSHEERQKAASATRQKRQETKKVKELLLGERGLEDFSREELITLRSRIDGMLGGSAAANERLVAERPGTSKGHVVTVYGSDPNKKYEVQYEIREMDDLITSNTDSGSINPDFPKELQPRDRTRAASRQQVDQIARKLEPDAVLDEFKAIDRGTPIIGDDNVVESGNGRSMALRRARNEYPEQFAAYQDRLKEVAAERGIDPAVLDQYENPVLVRVRKSDVDRVEFAKEANTASILSTSDTERARSDASRISSEHLQNLSTRDTIDDTLRAADNRDFVRNFVANTPETERAAMMDRTGNLTQAGQNRIKGAMFNRVYDSPDLSDRIFESPDNDIKNITNGLMNSLGPMSRAEEMVRTGQRAKDLSITGDISKAVEQYTSIRKLGLSVDNYLAQGQLFGRDLTPVQERILVEIDKRKRSGKQVKDFFDAWPSMVEREPHPNQGSLFGSAGRSKDELVDAWIKAAQQPNPGQIGLFQADYGRLIATSEAILIVRGGKGSGNWGHVGRPGKKGGSGGGGGLAKIGAKPGSSHEDRRAASAKHRSGKKTGGSGGSTDKLDAFLKDAPSDQAAFTSHLMDKVGSGEITFSEAQELQGRFSQSAGKSESKKSFDPADVKGDVPRGKEYNGLTLDEAPAKWDNWAGGLSKAERDALIDYQSEPFDDQPTDYTKINGHLRGQDKNPSKATRDAVGRMDRALAKSRVPEDTVVYRGFPASVLGDNPERLIGSTIRDRGYASTSLSKQVAGGFGKVVTEIRVPKGARGGLLDSLKSGKDSEYELLLPRDSEFRILSVDRSGGRTNVVMELVQ